MTPLDLFLLLVWPPISGVSWHTSTEADTGFYRRVFEVRIALPVGGPGASQRVIMSHFFKIHSAPLPIDPAHTQSQSNHPKYVETAKLLVRMPNNRPSSLYGHVTFGGNSAIWCPHPAFSSYGSCSQLWLIPLLLSPKSNDRTQNSSEPPRR